MNKNLQLVYDAVLSTPGMSDTVRLDVKPSRKMVLLLSQVVERGLSVKDGDGIIEALPESALTELTELIDSFMERAGMTELGKKLKNVQGLKG